MMHIEVRKKGANSASIVDSIIKSSASRKTYFLFWRFVRFRPVPDGRNMRQKFAKNFSPLFNGNAVLLGSEAQTDRAFIGRKDFKLAREMYLFPLAQIAAAYQPSIMRISNCARVEESANIHISQLME